MSAFLQALLMDDLSTASAGAATCVADTYYSCGPTNDPYWANVVLMLHMDSNFNDSSTQNCSPTAVGNAAISTAAPKFGAGCGIFDGNGDWITYADADLALGTGDFTIECWVKVGTLSASQKGILGNSGGPPYWFFGKNTANTLFFTQNAGSATEANSAAVAGTWYHVAVVRSGTTIRMYIDGIVQTLTGPFTDSTNYTLPTTLYVGNYGTTAGDSFDGQIDDLRITKGVARYTGNFNIPAAAFPDALETVWSPTDARTVLSLHAEPTASRATSDAFNPTPVNTRAGVTFSNGNKTVAYVSAGAYAAVATRARRSGKYYWEVYLTNFGNGTFMGFVRRSVAETAAWIQQLQTTPATDGGNGGFYVNWTGGTAYNAGGGPTLASAGAGKTYMFAVDFDNAKIWIGVDGVWHNSGAPAAGTNVTLTMLDKVAGYPVVSSDGSFGGGSNFTIRLSTADFAYSPPTGFSAWAATEGGTNDEFPTADSSCAQTKTVTLTGTASISTAEEKYGNSSFAVVNTGGATLNGVVVTDHQDFDFGTGDFSIECWAYRTANTYAGTLFYYSETAAFSLVAVVTTGLVTLNYRSSGGTQANIATGITFPLNTWQYVVVQRRGTNFEFYLNGAAPYVTAIAGGASSTVNSAGNLFIGRTNASSAVGWNGYIDEFRVTKGAARYAPVPFSVPVAAFPDDSTDPHWANVVLMLHMDGTNGGTTFIDSSLVGHAVTAVGTGQLGTAEKKFGTASGKFFNVLSVANRADIASSANLNLNGDFTWEAWVFTRDAAANSQYFTSLTPASSNTTFAVGWSTAVVGKFTVLMRNGAGTTFNINSTSASLSTNTWTHVAAVMSGTLMSLYVNGVLEGSGNIEGTRRDVNHSAAIPSDIVYALDGYIDDLRITKGIARYSADFTPPALTFCDSTTVPFSTTASGREALTGIAATAVTGTITAPNSFITLTGQSVTASAGTTTSGNSNVSIELIGQAATALYTDYFYEGHRLLIPPYPYFYHLPVPSTLHLAVTASNSINQRCKVRLLLNADWSVSTDVIIADYVRSSSVPPYWLFSSSIITGGPPLYTPAQVNNAFASSYTGRNGAITSGSRTGTSTFAMTNGVDMSAGAYWEIDVTDSATSAESFFTEYIILSPKTNNPRYGEFNYNGIFYFTISISAYGSGS